MPGTEIAGYKISFSASRLRQHYVLKVILPLLLIVLMSFSVFWIDPTLGASQISVSVTSMLTLVTLSTIGFGDITPVSRVARMLAVMQAITGMFYVAVLISRLVSIHASNAMQSPKEPPR